MVVWIRSWRQGVGCGLDHGGRVWGVFVVRYVR